MSAPPDSYGPDSDGPNSDGPGYYGPGYYGPGSYGPGFYGPNSYGPGFYGQDPYGQSPFSYDPLGRAPYAAPPTGPPVLPPPPVDPRPAPANAPVNAFATLSLVFAFLCAPAGALLGHVALAQIRRTGERGHGRAVAGVALSYASVILAVFALVAWAMLAEYTSSRTAASGAPASTAEPAPTVAPRAVGALLPNLGDLRNITGDQNLAAGQTWDHPARSDREGTIDRPQCWGSIAPGTPDAYTAGAIFGYRAAEFSDTRSFLKSTQVIQAVAALRDPPAARSQLDTLLSGWRDCGGSTVAVTVPGREAIPFSLGEPSDAGDGITTLDLAPRGLQVRSVRAIAARSNVVVDLYVSCSGTTDGRVPRQSAVSIANYILDKIPQ
ncbi:sensor domain-containing protein [Mycobacterium sp. Lab-001]|uniref:sensor domain-containing protein n=1 Tax=Mycobacterium sp. Lab-001 TaxID=3410136 RepID=UPI003D167D12